MSRTWRWLLKIGTAPAVVLLALSCGGGGGSSPTEPNAGPKTVTVAVKDFAYEPRSVTINPGDTVRWTLQGNDLMHTVTALNGAFNSGFTSPGAVFERKFTVNDAGKTFDYSCQTHKNSYNMKGSIRVGANAPPPNPGYE